MNSPVERSIQALSDSYHEIPLTCLLMTSQLIQWLHLQIAPECAFRSERVKKIWVSLYFSPCARARWGKDVFQSKFNLNKFILFELFALSSFSTSKNVTYTVGKWPWPWSMQCLKLLYSWCWRPKIHPQTTETSKLDVHKEYHSQFFRVSSYTSFVIYNFTEYRWLLRTSCEKYYGKKVLDSLSLFLYSRFPSAYTVNIIPSMVNWDKYTKLIYIDFFSSLRILFGLFSLAFNGFC